MITIDSRRPVIVGAGQHTQRTNSGEAVMEPAELFAHAIRTALVDAGTAPARVGSVRLVRSVSALPYRNAPLLAATLAGVAADEYVVHQGGGETPGAALTRACEAIASGEHDAIVLVAGEAWYSQTQAERAGETLVLTDQPGDTAPPTVHGALLDFVHPAEAALGIERPIQQYPLFEQALRTRAGRTVPEHQAHLGRLVERFSLAAQTNPYAWDRSPHPADEISTPSPSNRMVGFPYTKLMVSNEQVDMAAALLVTSAAWASEHGVERDRWVFPLAAAGGEAPLVSERFELHDSVLARCVRQSVEELSGLQCAQATHVDLYSCFPSAVQIQANELGLAVDGVSEQPLSITGGMRFSGGPWCGYSMHGFAAMTSALRERPGELGLVSANGGAISKLVVTLLSTEPSDAFRHASAQAAIDASPRRALAEQYVGSGTVESATVMHGRGGVPLNGVVAARLPDDRRAWGIVRDHSQIQAMLAEDVLGATIHVQADGTATLH